jgi:hypothetical protein
LKGYRSHREEGVGVRPVRFGILPTAAASPTPPA